MWDGSGRDAKDAKGRGLPKNYREKFVDSEISVNFAV